MNKFINKFQLSLPELTDLEDGRMQITNRLAIQVAESLDNRIVEVIIEMAKKAGVNDLVILNKQEIVTALVRQIPKKPILDVKFPSGIEWYFCPACNQKNIEKSDEYCHKCGQALDWSDTQ